MFNVELIVQLSQVGVNVILLNILLLFKEGMVNLVFFGLVVDQNLIGICFSGNGCIMNLIYGINGSMFDLSKLLFNDSVYLIIIGQCLIVDYIYLLLLVFWELILLLEMVYGILCVYQDELCSQWQVDWENWQNVGQWCGFVGGGGQCLDFDFQDSVVSGDGNGYNLIFGGSYCIDEVWCVGVVVGFYWQKLEVGVKDFDY